MKCEMRKGKKIIECDIVNAHIFLDFGFEFSNKDSEKEYNKLSKKDKKAEKSKNEFS